MSTAELTAAPDRGAQRPVARHPGAFRSWCRLLGSELRLVFRRLRNLALLAVLIVLPVAGVSLILGVALFPVGPVTLLSGTTVPLADGLLRLLFVTLYVAAAMAALGAIGLAVSTLTEHAIGAIAAIMILAVASEVTDNVPQFAAVHAYLPTHWWLSFDALLRSPVATRR